LFRTRFLILFFWFYCSLTAIPALASDETSTILYTYHHKPPFIVDEKKRIGLYYDLATYFNNKLTGHTFSTEYLPRKRLDYLLKINALNGFVVGVSPIWFNDKKEQKYLWLDTIYQDRDEFVSLKQTPFEFKQSQSLKGKAVAGVAGYYYHGINEMVSKGQTLRIDTINEKNVLSIIEKGRADVGIVSVSVFKYLNKLDKLDNIYHFSEIPHDAFDRRVMTTQSQEKVYKQLLPIINTMMQDREWLKMINKYQ